MATSRSSPSTGGGAGLLFAIVVAAWIAGIAFLLYPTAWAGEQFALALGRQWPGQSGLVVACVHAGAILLPSLAGLALARLRRYRSIFATWVVAAVFVLFALPVRFAGLTEAIRAAALQVLCLALYLALLWGLRRQRDRRLDRPSGPFWPVLVLLPLIVWPWVAWGALGSPLDTVLNLSAALLFGLAAALTLTWRLLPDIMQTGADAPANVTLGGMATAAVLVTMASALGANGQQLILMVLIPSLAWLVFGIVGLADDESPADGDWGVAALLISLVAAAPMLFIDPDELSLIINLGTRDVGAYAVLATLISATTALVLSLPVYVLTQRTDRSWHRPGMALAGIAWFMLLGVFLVVGQPGWHGERLFVILRGQADIAPAAHLADMAERRSLVYDVLTEHAAATQQPLREGLRRWGIDSQPYYLVNGLEVDGGPLIRLWLSRWPEVDRILDSPELRPLPQLPPQSQGDEPRPTAPQWNLEVLAAPRVWDELGVTGTGIVVGHSDSGVDVTHPELSAQYRGDPAGSMPGDDYNWLDPWRQTSSPTDQSGHGTHTLGSVLGRSVGVAPDATWIGCVNLARNLGNVPRYLDCLQFLLAPFPPGGNPLADGRPELGADILNNSWGCPEIEGCDADALLPAVRALRAAGVFVVVSAGNTGPICASIGDPPALYDEAFSVGAIDDDLGVAPFSSRGPVTVDGSGRTKPDVVAPGVDVLSSFPGGTYAYNSGTSMAGPHVAGVVALMWSANPGLVGDIEATERILTRTALPLDQDDGIEEGCGDSASQPNNTVGFGLVDAFAAVQEALGQP